MKALDRKRQSVSTEISFIFGSKKSAQQGQGNRKRLLAASRRYVLSSMSILLGLIEWACRVGRAKKKRKVQGSHKRWQRINPSHDALFHILRLIISSPLFYSIENILF
jgi:hypothetical protein